jgi:sugar phosphate isomerase/epimerase
MEQWSVMFAVSTCWKSARAKSGGDIIGPILDAGVTAVELEYRITDEIFREILPFFKREELRAVSVHNFFPLPPGFAPEQASGDIFLLSSTDKEERERAVRYTLHTLERAYEVGARAVVLHLGRTDIDDQFTRLAEEREQGTLDGDSVRGQAHTLLMERKREGRKHLDAALFSLDRLWRPAERLGITLGVENRYHLREVPDPDELEIILERFDGSNVGYWHDVGHAAVQEFLYGLSHKEMLSRFSARMIGVHLHDADGVKDHQAPGKGKIDFEMMKEFIVPDTTRVIELAPEVSGEDLQKSIDLLAGILA